MPRSLARRAVLLLVVILVVRRYTYIAFGKIWAAFFRFSSSFIFFVDPLWRSQQTPGGPQASSRAPALALAAEELV